MTFATFNPDIDLRNDRIREEDAARQHAAAEEILRRLDVQPGVILADEVGMGKTFVALATAVSIVRSRPDAGPVVVMHPPNLKDKWPRDWEVFSQRCLRGEAAGTLRAASADTGVAFLRLLDDPPEKQNHLIFLTHGALNRSVGDVWVKLAIVRRCFAFRRSLAQQRASFVRFAGRLLRAEYVERMAPGLFATLLDNDYRQWLRIINRDAPGLALDDDPVPQHLADALYKMPSSHLDALADVLAAIPLRESKQISDRLTSARRAISTATEEVWRLALRAARFHSPLLILDEAHHAKNPAAKLSTLFASEDAASEASKYVGEAGPLGGKFDRMLFLTATPFQLGHRELLSVLARFEGVSWQGLGDGSSGRREHAARLRELGERLDDAQSAALRLDRAWGKIDLDVVARHGGSVDDWWASVGAGAVDAPLDDLLVRVAATKAAVAAAERALSPWVLRYLKAAELPGGAGVLRRHRLPGAAILDEGSAADGLEIGPNVLLPFLLAGRAQALIASSSKGRALFADGLASSFEAYRETRAGKPDLDEDAEAGDGSGSAELEWYLAQLDRFLPRGGDDINAAHPKITATARRAAALWCAGEKVLIFCHYRATGRALRQHISALLDKEIVRLASAKLPGRDEDEVRRRLELLSDRFYDNDRLRAAVDTWLREVVQRHDAIGAKERESIVEAVQRFLRTPSFLVRYMPLDTDDMSGAFEAAVAPSGPGSLRQSVEAFVQFLAARVPSERAEYLEALLSVQTGSHHGREVTDAFDQGELGGSSTTVLLPNVRLANGEVRAETRRKLLLTFNTPLFPEILIASSVMAEGVDLHLNCRYVIHHDLSWNPSTLEQRSGRVDRIGSKAERVQRPIELYLPYVAATQDEKMYRVVMDRERWFQVVMGERYEIDEAATERRAERVPLPDELQRELTMRLHP